VNTVTATVTALCDYSIQVFIMLGLAFRRVFLPTARRTIPLHRSFAAAAGLPKDQIEKRVISVLKGSERVDATKVA
jgi:hypothetical protein